MNRRIGKLKLLLQCFLLGLLMQRSCAQQHERYPYNSYDDDSDYYEPGRYDDHHPLDNQKNYGYPRSSQEYYGGGEYSPDMYEQYNSREENAELPATSQNNIYHPNDARDVEPRHNSDNMYREEDMERERGREYESERMHEREHEHDRDSNNGYDYRHSREEIPEPRIITPPIYQEHHSDSNSNDMYEHHNSREEIPEHYNTRVEYPEPRIITPPVFQDHRTGDIYNQHHAMEEIPEPRIITSPESLDPRRPHYTHEDMPEYNSQDHHSNNRYTPSHVPETESHHTNEIYEPLHQREGAYDNRVPQEVPSYQHPHFIAPTTERVDEQLTVRPPSYQENFDYSHHMEQPHTGSDYGAAQPQPDRRESHIIAVPRLGSVRGYREFKIINNRPISAYLGLKYATVRSGLGRFQQAVPHHVDPRSVIDATKEPPNCPQFPELDIITQKETRGENVDDCLTLNIYTPARPGSYPVIVFVHGEMLFDGSAEEGQPDYFLENDVVLASINYRLAPFGFLSTLTDDMPGNVALSDIHMALEWIQEHIRSFNGDSDQVTLLGQAGGATLIHALSLSGKAEGLFHKLILQSGTALNPYFLDEQPLSTLRGFAHYARCPVNRSNGDFAACFERMTTSELLNHFKTYFESNEPRGLVYASAYKLILGDKLGYLPEHPASMVSNNNYPMIVGVTKDAGAFIMSRFYDQLDELRSHNISDYINIVLKHTAQPKHYQLWTRWALTHIFTSEDIRNPTVSGLVQKLLELVNLILYRAPVVDSIRYTSKNHSTFMYCFDYRGEFHRFGHLRNPLPFEIDATLSDDNIFLFPYPEEVSHLNPKDKSVARTLVTMWVNFAQHGVPNFDQRVWPNVTTEYGPFLRFTNVGESKLEIDYHFGDGIPVPNLYPEYFTTTTTTTTTTPRPYRSYHQQQQQQPNYHQQQQPDYPQYPNYPQHPNYRYPAQNQHSPNYRPRGNAQDNPQNYARNYPMRH